MDSLHGGVVRLFRTYVSELDELMRFARTGQQTTAMDTAPTAEANRLPPIARRLTEILNRLQFESGQRHGFLDASEFDECRYAMVALADDRLLSTEWPGRQAWLREPLELRLFGTQKAGQEIFDRIEKLLSKDLGDGRELAVVYLLTLSMGFRGCLRDAPGAARIGRMKQQLFNAFFHRSPDLEHLQRRKLTPNAYRNVLAETNARQLPYLRPWIIAAIVLLVSYVGITSVAWFTMTAPIIDLVENLRRLVGP